MIAAVGEPAPPGRAWGRVRGIQLRVTMGSLLFAGWLVIFEPAVVASRFVRLGAEPWVAAVLISLAFSASVLLHEFGHAGVGRWFGLRVRWIVLDALGGETDFDRDAATAGSAALIAAAGPAVSLVVAVAFGAAAHGVAPRSMAQFVLEQLALGNGVVAVFNLLPGLPLDGGYVVGAAVWAATGRERTGEVVAAVGGLVTAAAIVLVPVVLMTNAGAEPGQFGAAILILIAAPVARGAWAALTRPAPQRPMVMPSALTLSAPALSVAAGEPVQEALRMITARGAAALIVVNPDGTLIGVCREVELASVPAAQRSLIPVAAVTPPLQPGQVIPGWLSGEELRRHLRASSAPLFLLGDAPRSAPRVLLSDVLGVRWDPVPMTGLQR